MPVVARAHRGNWLHRWLAPWFVALLAVAPFARPSLPVESAALAAVAVDSLIAPEDGSAQAKQPAAGTRPAQPLSLGILSRLSSVETALGLPPAKPPLLRPSAPEVPRGAGQAPTAFGDLRQVFHPSSVGTARVPTGPPS